MCGWRLFHKWKNYHNAPKAFDHFAICQRCGKNKELYRDYE